VSGRVVASGPSDPGLAGERTSLAWARVGLALLAVPSGLLAYAAGRGLLPALVAATGAAVMGLALLVASLSRHRADAGMVAHRRRVLAGNQVVLAAATIVLIDIAGLALILGVP
jgi:uncharacterized membrane protein YidH (DUF202 family)